MFGSKREKRYNAYVKKTESGIIVKTVDSVTGVESLIKFTSDSINIPREILDPSKENVKHNTNKFNEANPCVNKNNKYVLPESNTTVTKLNNLRPYLKEIHQDIPGFDVYEDSDNSTFDFQNPNVIFVANSKLAKRDGVFNLKIPGKLGNIFYHGILNENGVVNFKAKSVVKPFTIVIGEYVINVNICHDLTSGSNMQKQNQPESENEGDYNKSNYCHKGDAQLINKDKLTQNNKIDKEPINNNIKVRKYSNDCRNQDFKTKTVKSDMPSVKLESIGPNKTEGKMHNVAKNNVEKVSELSTCDSTLNLYTHKGHLSVEQLDKLLPEKMNPTEAVANSLLPNVKVSTNNVLSKQSSENVIVKTGPTKIINNRIEQNVKSCERCDISGKNESIRNCLSSNTNCCAVPDNFEINRQCFSTQSIKSESNKHCIAVCSNVEKNELIQADRIFKRQDNTVQIQNNRCVSMIEIKRRLNSVTTSLHNLCSVIQSIENVSKKSFSAESVGTSRIGIPWKELDKTTQGGSNGTNSNPFIVAMNKISENNQCHNERNGKTYLTEENKVLKKESNAHKEDNCEHSDDAVLLPKDSMSHLPVKYITSNLMEQSHGQVVNNKFCEKVENDKKYNNQERTGYQFNFQDLRQIKSLVNMSESRTPLSNSVSRAGGTTERPSINILSKTTPNVILKRKYTINSPLFQHQRVKSATKFSSKSKVVFKDRFYSYHKFQNNKMSHIPLRRKQTPYMRCRQQRKNRTNSEQESEISKNKTNSYSTSSIKTLYIKPDCKSSNNISVPFQRSKMQMFSFNKGSSDVYNNTPLIEEEVVKNSFRRKIKKQIIRVKTHLWNFGASNNRIQSNKKQSTTNSQVNALTVEPIYKTNIKTEDTEECLMYKNENPEYLSNLNDSAAATFIHHENFAQEHRFDYFSTCSKMLESNVFLKESLSTNPTKNTSYIDLKKNYEAFDTECFEDQTGNVFQCSDYSFKK